MRRRPNRHADPKQSELRSSSAESIELLTDVRAAVEQIESGQGVSNRQAKADLRRQLGNQE